MRSKLVIPFLVLAALMLAACGSKSSSSSSKGSTGSTSTAAPGKKPPPAGAVPSRTYSVKLTGKAETPPGAPKGSGRAVVSIHGKTLQVCWRFARLRSIDKPTFAHIHKGGAGTSGPIVVPLSTAPKFASKGCAHSNASLLNGIEKDPHGYYVNVHTKKYPGGAVRAQL